MLHVVIAGVVFNAVQAGKHSVHVRLGGNDIDGSPFTVMISDLEVGRADAVKVYGRGLSDGQTGQPCQFHIDMSDAGTQSRDLTVGSFTKRVCDCRTDNLYYMHHVPPTLLPITPVAM